jgi:hypothetical protein
MILQAGRQVVGVDQSGGMLTEARAKHPEVTVEKVGLQELTFVAEFDAAICVDAMAKALRAGFQRMVVRGSVWRAAIWTSRRSTPASSMVVT